MPLRVGVCTGLLMAVLAATSVSAQTARRTISASVGFGEANPLPLELPFIARTWTAGIRIAAARHLSIEAAAWGWRHRSSDTSLLSMPDGSGQAVVLGRSTEVVRTATLHTSLAALATAQVGRVRLTSGAGAGISTVTSDITVTETDCTNPALHSCRPFHAASRLPLFAVQCILGADVALASRLEAFFSYRLVQPFSEPIGEVSYTAGLRVRVR